MTTLTEYVKRGEEHCFPRPSSGVYEDVVIRGRLVKGFNTFLLVSGETVLMRAAFEGDKDTVVAWAKRYGADRIAREDSLGRTALMRAACHDRPDMVELLLSLCPDMDVNHRADCPHEQNTGATALMVAAFSGCERVARVLLDRGADPRLTYPGGVTAAALASGAGHHRLAELLRLEAGLRDVWDDAVKTQ